MTFPLTRSEAEQHIYGRNEGMYRGSRYDPERCAYEVGEPPWYISHHQCKRKPGHGPDGLFCKQHAKIVVEWMA